MDAVASIESALFAHWSLFGRGPGAELRDEQGLLWFATPITHLPYNGVIRTRLPEGEAADGAIAAAIRRFRERGAEFVWFDHPSATPADLGARLARHGVQAAEEITCMWLELAAWQAPPPPEDVEYREVLTGADVRAYSELTIRYWEIPTEEQPLVAELHRRWDGGRRPGLRFLAFVEGEPVGKAYLSLAGSAREAAIFGMSVRPEARGRGIAAGLTTTLLERARREGRERVVLHSTQMARPVYRRAGFAECCELTIHATAPLWSGSH